MKQSTVGVKLTRDEKLTKLANELYYRTKGKKFVNGSQAIFGEFDENGHRKTLVETLGISKTIGITTFIELGLIETENGKKYTSSSMIRWCGDAPTKDICKAIKLWNREYNRKWAEKKLATAQAKAEAELTQTKIEFVEETPVESPTIASKEELNNMLGSEVAQAPVETQAPAPQSNFDRLTSLQQFIAVQIERNDIEAQRNRILASMLNELKKLNESKIILGQE